MDKKNTLLNSILVPLPLLMLLLAGTSAWGVQAPGLNKAAADAIIPDHYIVVLREDTANPASIAQEMASAHNLRVGHVYTTALKGFSAFIPPARLAAVERHPRVAYVEPDQMVYTFAQTIPTGIRRIFADTNPNITINDNDRGRLTGVGIWIPSPHSGRGNPVSFTAYLLLKK